MFTSTTSTLTRPHARRRSILLVAAATAAAITAMTAGGVADAAPISNTPTIQLGRFAIPATAPAYVNGGDLLPRINGTLGNPTTIFMSGSTVVATAGSQVIEIPGGSATWGTGVRTNDTIAASTSQTWYFQRVGWVGVGTPAVDGVRRVVGAPAYKIIQYNPSGGYTCLDALGGSGAPGTAVGSSRCAANNENSTNQLWIVASTAQSNDTFNPATGIRDEGSARQIFSPPLQQSNAANATGLENSIIMNVASLVDHGWDTTQTPVLSAAVDNTRGVHSRLWLKAPTDWPADTTNSTWNITPSYTFNAIITPQDKCAGVKGVAALACGGTFEDYFDWLNTH